MPTPSFRRIIACLSLAILLQGCGESGLFSRFGNNAADTQAVAADEEEERQSTIWDLFDTRDDPNITIAVNKYLWTASIEVLNFLPIQSADPFSGLIVTGYGTPPGGRTAYRATILVQDPALDARSLNVSLATRRGPVDEQTRVAVENAILARARQLRIRDLNL